MSSTRSFPTASQFPMRLIGIALALAVLLSAALGTATTLAVGGSEFVSITNEYRVSKGLAPVSLHAAVDRIAVERADQMAKTKTFAHDMDYVKSRLQQLGVCWSNVGEIIAWEGGYPSHSYERTMAQWWGSPGHHAIIVGDFNAAGGSWSVSSNGKTYSAMIFIKTCGASATTKSTVASIGRVVLASGTHVGYLFNGSTVVGSKAATLSRTSGADVSARQKINGKTYLKIANGIWAGYWVLESYRAYIPGYFDRMTYPSPIRLVFDEGTHIALKYYSSGNWYARIKSTFSRRSGADATQWAIINGKAHFYVVNGMFAGYWIPDKTNVWPAR
jgi:hypothetical protein